MMRMDTDESAPHLHVLHAEFVNINTRWLATLIRVAGFGLFVIALAIYGASLYFARLASRIE
jgi:hypothetical protein